MHKDLKNLNKMDISRKLKSPKITSEGIENLNFRVIMKVVKKLQASG